MAAPIAAQVPDQMKAKQHITCKRDDDSAHLFPSLPQKQLTSTPTAVLPHNYKHVEGLSPLNS